MPLSRNVCIPQGNENILISTLISTTADMAYQKQGRIPDIRCVLVLHYNIFSIFRCASHLYKRVCRFVGPSVRHAFVKCSFFIDFGHLLPLPARTRLMVMFSVLLGRVGLSVRGSVRGRSAGKSVS